MSKNLHEAFEDEIYDFVISLADKIPMGSMVAINHDERYLYLENIFAESILEKFPNRDKEFFLQKSIFAGALTRIFIELNADGYEIAEKTLRKYPKNCEYVLTGIILNSSSDDKIIRRFKKTCAITRDEFLLFEKGYPWEGWTDIEKQSFLKAFFWIGASIDNI